MQRGAWVQEVSKGGPAARAGIHAGTAHRRFQARPFETGGDVIVSVGRHKIVHDDDVALSIMHVRPGTSLRIGVIRNGKRLTITVKVGERPLSTRPRG